MRNTQRPAAEDRLFQFRFNRFAQDDRIGLFLPAQSTLALVGRGESFFDQGTGTVLRSVEDPDGARFFGVFGFFYPSAWCLNCGQKTANVILVLVMGDGAELVGTADVERYENFTPPKGTQVVRP